MARKKSLIALIQDAIAKGANTAEDIHRSIADKPLKVLEKIEVLRGPTKKIKRVQDESIGSIYDLIREINEQVGNYARDLLADASKAGAGAARAGTKAKAAVKKSPVAAAAKKLVKAVPAKPRAARTAAAKPAAAARKTATPRRAAAEKA